MRVLIAEDDPVSRRVLETTLSRWGYDVVATGNGQEAWDVLRAGEAPKLAILDWMMPEIDGAQLCRMLRRQEEDDQDYTYVILLTAKGRTENVIEGLDAGADDYIVKPFESGELKVRLMAAKRILNLQRELLKAQEALRVEATHDSLTGVWNRAAVLDILHNELARGQREGTSTSIILADIDHFKAVNDNHGHRAGDAALQQVAARMSAATRPYDSVGRYGGEEFLLILPGCQPGAAADRADRIRLAVSETPISASGAEIPLTLSAGVAATEPGQAPDVEGLIHAADAAMYVAKQSGRNSVESSAAAGTVS